MYSRKQQFSPPFPSEFPRSSDRRSRLLVPPVASAAAAAGDISEGKRGLLSRHDGGENQSCATCFGGSAVLVQWSGTYCEYYSSGTFSVVGEKKLYQGESDFPVVKGAFVQLVWKARALPNIRKD